MNSALGNFLSGINQELAINARSSDEVGILQELPVETLFLALKQSDAESALWFYKNAETSQIQGILDLDVWQGDEFQVERFENHFKMMSLVEPEKLVEYMKELDPEVIVLALMRWVEVQDFDPQNPPDTEESRMLLTLDSKYALILKTENPEIRELLYLWINKTSMGDIDILRRHLESCKWEQETDLEEHAFQFKKGRLEELGFVDYYDAIVLYSRGRAADEKDRLLKNPLPFDAKFFGVAAPDSESDLESESSLFPDIIVSRFQGEGFLAEALREIKDHHKKQILHQELIRTLNASFVADKIMFESVEALGVASERAKRYLDLGLFFLSDGQKSRAAELILVQPFMEIFRLGWLSVAELTQAAKTLLLNFGPGLFEDRDLEVLNTLSSARHPELSLHVLKDLGLYPEPAHLIHTKSLLAVGAHIKKLADFAAQFLSLLGGPLKIKELPLQGSETAFSRLCTSIFRQASGFEFAIKPLSKNEFFELYSKFDLGLAEKLCDGLGSRFQGPSQAMFTSRLKSSLGDVALFIKSNPQPKVPDQRFFKALVFEL